MVGGWIGLGTTCGSGWLWLRGLRSGARPCVSSGSVTPISGGWYGVVLCGTTMAVTSTGVSTSNSRRSPVHMRRTRARL